MKPLPTAHNRRVTECSEAAGAIQTGFEGDKIRLVFDRVPRDISISIKVPEAIPENMTLFVPSPVQSSATSIAGPARRSTTGIPIQVAVDVQAEER